MKSVQQMPSGYKYDASDARIDTLATAIRNSNGHLQVDPSKAGDSFCSGCTYMVLMKALSLAQANHQTHLSNAASNALLVHSKSEQPDGYGAWGRWNADGPGSAVMVKDLKAGDNFVDELGQAVPGDFIKLFWNNVVGENGKQSESGHSVVFDSFRNCAQGPSVCFWACNSINDVRVQGDAIAQNRNKPKRARNGGWALKCVPESKIKHSIITRVTDLNAFNNAAMIYSKNSPYYVNERLNQIGGQSLMPWEEAATMATTGNMNPQAATSTQINVAQ